jgi:VCBS repeat-containing protein
MRYDDASGSFSSAQAGTPDARDDADALATPKSGSATGNTITGAGTITGLAGADLVPDGKGHIVALEGAGGSDTSDGGRLHVGGRYGDLTMDTQGNYTYKPAAGTPDGVRDVFRYTLADAEGERDSAMLTIDIGREVEKIDANAQQIVPGPDGVVTLPPGVELSDVHVVGRNLVIDMPDGTQMVIIDGAVFVPQLVLNGVEVPATNLAALLIDSEPKPAGGIPQSSGGNFDVPVPPLDPGVPLGDLIPPTELTYNPPEFHEVNQFVDQEPEIFVQPDGQPATIAAVDSVDEKGLPERDGNLPDEPAGSGEIADGNGLNDSDSSEATTGVIIVNSPDDPSVVRINGVVVTGVVGQEIDGQFGTLTITSFSDGQIGYSYVLTDNNLLGNNSHDDFSVSVTDNDGDVATATLTINIVDDTPTARNDTDATVDGVATGNVMTDAAPGDLGDTDTNAADTVGADNATLTSVSGAGGSDSTFSEGVLNVNGQIGSLVIDAQGN